MPNTIKIIGHRGCLGEEPENTLLGIQSALAKKVDGIEIDVHLTKDGKLAVIHDPTVDRTTDGSGRVAEMTYEEILKLDAGKGERVPLLSEVMAIMGTRELFIEIKCARAEEKVVSLVEKMKQEEQVIIKSFNHRVVKKVKDLNRNIRTACLVAGLPIHGYFLAEDAGANMLSVCSKTIDQALVDECHEKGVEVCVWCANSRKELDIVAGMGVDYICTDYPSRLLP